MWITLLDPAANLQEILRIEEQVELHQENAISKIYTVGNSAGQVMFSSLDKGLEWGGSLSIERILKT